MQTYYKIIQGVFLLLTVLIAPYLAWGQETNTSSMQPTLVKAVMSESIEKFAPINPAIVFSIELGKITCFTEFDPVPEKTVILHKWYKRDSLISVKRLTVTPPRWSSFSSMQLRDADKGPWRVEITDGNGKIITILRFSITE